MKKRLLMVVLFTAMTLALCACSKQDEKSVMTPSATKEQAEKPTSEKQTTDGREIISTSFSYFYEMTNWKEDDMGYERPPILYVTYDAAKSDYVQIDCSEWFNPNTYISIPHPMTSGDYWMSTYSEGGSTDYRVNVEIGVNTISIKEYGTDGELAEFTAHFKKKK